MMDFPPRMPSLPAEQELHLRQRLANDRVSRGFKTPLVWYIVMAVIIVVLFVLMAIFGFHWF